jgi:hypothetical protein
MGFGGGGSGSFVLPNHKHTNVLADGGDLEEAVTLVDGVTLAAWLTAKGFLSTTTITTANLAATFTNNTGTLLEVTGMSIVLTNVAGGACTILFNSNYSQGAGKQFRFVIADDGTNVNEVRGDYASADAHRIMSLTWALATDGSDVSVMIASETPGGAFSCYSFSAGQGATRLITVEVS